MTKPTPKQGKPELKDFDIEVCRMGVGFNSIRVRAENEFEAGQQALDEAGNHLYSEKSSEYTLVNPVPNPAERAPERVMEVFMELTCDEGMVPMAGVKLDITQTDLDRFQNLFKLMDQENLSEVRRYHYPDYLYAEDADNKEDSLDAPEMVFSGEAISLQGFARKADYIAMTNAITFSELVAAFHSGADKLIINAGYPASSALEFFENAGQTVTDLDVGTRTIVIGCSGKMTADEYQDFLSERDHTTPEREL